MRQVTYLLTAFFLLAAFLAAPVSTAMAESEVLESNIEEFPVGTKIDDETRIVMQEESRMRVLIVTTGSTKTLQGPYEGTIPNYREERSWWERITGRSREDNAPIGATRGLLPQPSKQQQ